MPAPFGPGGQGDCLDGPPGKADPGGPIPAEARGTRQPPQASSRTTRTRGTRVPSRGVFWSTREWPRIPR
ncbi:MAG: hypothetical protein EOP26_14525 [Rhodococcus sp. (in: high G+C Gram-positive bacteria)]|nr:MAG: hypothetical protein EOP26_14525 [Rhodococcus sp. (in: high G+C Gram-positive bacteria)]